MTGRRFTHHLAERLIRRVVPDREAVVRRILVRSLSNSLWMFESLLAADTLGWIECQELLQQVQG